MKWIKYLAAKWLLSRFKMKPGECGDLDAARWNHLKAIVATKGMVKWDWNKVRKIAVIKCSRCLLILGKAEEYPESMRGRGDWTCLKCIGIQLGKEEKVKKRTGTRKRKTSSRKPKRVRKNS